MEQDTQYPYSRMTLEELQLAAMQEGLELPAEISRTSLQEALSAQTTAVAMEEAQTRQLLRETLLTYPLPSLQTLAAQVGYSPQLPQDKNALVELIVSRQVPGPQKAPAPSASSAQLLRQILPSTAREVAIVSAPIQQPPQQTFRPSAPPLETPAERRPFPTFVSPAPTPFQFGTVLPPRQVVEPSAPPLVPFSTTATYAPQAIVQQGETAVQPRPLFPFQMPPPSPQLQAPQYQPSQYQPPQFQPSQFQPSQFQPSFLQPPQFQPPQFQPSFLQPPLQEAAFAPVASDPDTDYRYTVQLCTMLAENTVPELRKIAAQLGLSTLGTKRELCTRLQDHWQALEQREYAEFMNRFQATHEYCLEPPSSDELSVLGIPPALSYEGHRYLPLEDIITLCSKRGCRGVFGRGSCAAQYVRIHWNPLLSKIPNLSQQDIAFLDTLVSPVYDAVQQNIGQATQETQTLFQTAQTIRARWDQLRDWKKLIEYIRLLQQAYNNIYN